MTPTSRTLQLLRRRGFICDVVERFIVHAGIRRDLFGCIDLVAVKTDEAGVLGVQATSASNVSARLTKARGRPELRACLAAGNRFECWGWCKRGSRWAVRIVALRGEGLTGVVVEPLPRRRRLRKSTQAELFDSGTSTPTGLAR